MKKNPSIDYIKGAPFTDPEKRKNQHVGKINRVSIRGREMYCATFQDAKGQIISKFCETLEYAKVVMRNAGYNEL